MIPDISERIQVTTWFKKKKELMNSDDLRGSIIHITQPNIYIIGITEIHCKFTYVLNS